MRPDLILRLLNEACRDAERYRSPYASLIRRTAETIASLGFDESSPEWLNARELLLGDVCESVAAVLPQPIVLEVMHGSQAADGEPRVSTDASALAFAASINDCTSIARLVEQGVDVNLDTDLLGIPLHVAAAMGHVEATEALLKAGAELEAKGNRSITPLFIAAQRGHERVVEVLLAYGALKTDPYCEDNTAMHAALRNGGHIGVMRILLENGADIDELGANNYTVLQDAVVSNSSREMLEFLVRRGANVNGTGPTRHKPPLSHAAEMNNIMAAEILLKNGAWPDFEDIESAAHKAARHNHVEFLAVLKAYGADLGLKLRSACTPLHSACHQDGDTSAAVKYLLESGADVDSPDLRGETPLFCCLRGKQLENLKMVLSRNPDLEIADRYGRTVLCLAMDIDYSPRHGGFFEDATRLLLEAGAKVNTATRDREQPLHKAAGRGYLSAVRALLKYGANPNAKDWSGTTPLHDAAYGGHVEVVELLISHGADITARDEAGFSVLHSAVGCKTPCSPIWRLLNQAMGRRYGFPGLNVTQTIGILLDAGAVINAEDKEGRTPLHKAVEFRLDQSIIDLLTERTDLHAKGSAGHLVQNMTGAET